MTGPHVEVCLVHEKLPRTLLVFIRSPALSYHSAWSKSSALRCYEVDLSHASRRDNGVSLSQFAIP